MPTFSYKAKDKSGNTIAGSVEAIDEHAAAGIVREMGHLPMEIRISHATHPAVRSDEAGSVIARYLIYPLWTGVNIRMLAIFYRQLATLMSSGMSLSEALRSLGTRTRGRMFVIINEMQEHVQAGGRMSETMARYPRVFNMLQLSLVRAGEAGGLMESMIERIASYLEYELSIRSKISKIMFYPILILIAIVFIPHVPTAVLKGGGAFSTEVWGSVRIWLPWAICAIVLVKLLLQFRVFRYIWDIVKIQPPVLGTMARKIAMSRFSRALAVLYTAGMPMSESVNVAADACANIAIGSGIKHAVPAIQSGHGLTESLAKTRMVIPMVMDMLLVGEKTGSMDGVLNKVADYMDDEVDSTIHKAGIVLFVLMILIAGGIVLKIVLSQYLEQMKPIIQQEQQMP